MKIIIITIMLFFSLPSIADTIKIGCYISIKDNLHNYNIIKSKKFYLKIKNSNERRALREIKFLMLDSFLKYTKPHNIEYRRPYLQYEELIENVDEIYKQLVEDNHIYVYGLEVDCMDISDPNTSEQVYNNKIYKYERISKSKAIKTNFPDCTKDIDLENEYNYLGFDIRYQCENI